MKKISKNNKRGYIFSTKSIICTMLGFTTFTIMSNSCSDNELSEISNYSSSYESILNNDTSQTTINTYINENTFETSSTNITENSSYYNDEDVLNINDVEVTEYENAFDFNADLVNDVVYQCVLTDNGAILNYLSVGFDNLALRNSLQEFAIQQNNNIESDITIDNYRYFQYYETPLYQSNNLGFYESAETLPYWFQISRAVCVENNLRFLIDEIPSSYFYERFPEFMRIIDNGGIEELNSQILDYAAVYQSFYSETTQLSEFERDFCEFISCAMYNRNRYSFIYNYGAESFDGNYQNDVRQVRDQRNNRHVLVPTEEQYNEIMENLHEIPTFENIDIYQVETREEYFNAYGVYPEDVLSEERYDLNYEPYVSPYEFDVVQIDQNMNSNQGRSRTPN